MGTRRRYWVISGGIAATVLVAGTAAHAPGARSLLRWPGGSVRAVATGAAGDEDGRAADVEAVVDGLSARAGVWSDGVTAGGPARDGSDGEAFHIGDQEGRQLYLLEPGIHELLMEALSHPNFPLRAAAAR